MALKATVFKAELNIADMDRGYYQNHNLTIARHPSENDERMMVRVLAFAVLASEHLQFTRGLSTENEPDLWEKDYTGDVRLWIEVGLPDERRIKKACNHSEHAIIFAYGDRAAPVWRDQNKSVINRFPNLSVFFVTDEEVAALASLAERTMRLQCSVQDGQLWLGNGETTAEITPQKWKEK